MNVFIVISVCIGLFLLWKIAMKPPIKEPPVIEYRDKERDEDLFVESMEKALERTMGRAEREKEMSEYAYNKRKLKEKPPTIPFANYTDDKLHTTNPEGKNILIPENLSEADREILRQFYNL